MRNRNLPTPIVALLAVALLTLALLAIGCDSDSDDYAERMAEEHKDDVPVASPAAGVEPAAAVEAERVSYANVGGADVAGFLARPAAADGSAPSVALRDRAPSVPLRGNPGVIVIQEWWGLNENIESMARQLAGEGYLALAVDLYGGQVATDRDGARALMQAAMADPEALKDNLRQAHAYLTAQGASKVGSIGWCFGGGWSLQTALALPGELDAAVMYYGRVVNDSDQLATLTTPILGHFGSEDKGIPIDRVREFKKLLGELGKDAAVHVYEGAGHAFANPSGTRYNAEAAEQAWQRTLAFFDQHLKG